MSRLDLLLSYLSFPLFQVGLEGLYGLTFCDSEAQLPPLQPLAFPCIDSLPVARCYYVHLIACDSRTSPMA